MSLEGAGGQCFRKESSGSARAAFSEYACGECFRIVFSGSVCALRAENARAATSGGVFGLRFRDACGERVGSVSGKRGDSVWAVFSGSVFGAVFPDSVFGRLSDCAEGVRAVSSDSVFGKCAEGARAVLLGSVFGEIAGNVREVCGKCADSVSGQGFRKALSGNARRRAGSVRKAFGR